MFIPICMGEGGHRYWRIYYTGADSSGGFQLCSDLEMRSVLSGPDITGSGTASASDTDGASVASNAFDSNTSTLWASSTTGTGQWLKYVFVSPVAVKQIAYLANTLASRGPTGIRLEYADDDATWFAAQTWTPAAWVAGAYQVFTV